MFVKFKKIALFFSLVFAVSVSYLAYDCYQYNAFKRAYEYGTVREQLDVLMGYGKIIDEKRYVSDIRKTDYSIDDYNLKMNDFVTSLTTKNLKLTIVPESSDITIRYHYRIDDCSISIFQILDNNLKLKTAGIYYSLDKNGEEIERTELTDQEQEELRAIAVSEIETMLKDIYQSMYGSSDAK